MIANPITKKTEKRLDIAKNTIDMIDMIARKTGGNLDDEEEKIINNLLYESRMRYVNEMNASAKESPGADQNSTESDEANTA